ncbi:SBBP repeat-containing protein [Sorangium sp. So ce260]|uniref:SBBP repeat-containing protein n=1 Tax=Sorangium sp. So ce260 TaxID=3133291 RepID=UPI003F6385AC
MTLRETHLSQAASWERSNWKETRKRTRRIKRSIVAKFTSEGDFVWSQMFQDDENTAATDIAADSQDNTIVFGVADCLLCPEQTSHIWLNKYDSKGALIWSKIFPKYPEGPLPSSVTVDPFDNILITGEFSGTNAFDGDVLTSRGGADVFVVKYTGEGDFVWAWNYGDVSDQRGASIACDNLGNVILMGTFAGKINFFSEESQQLISGSERNIYIAEFSSAGRPLWSKSFESSSEAWGSDVAVDKDGNIFVTGAFNGQIDFGGENLISQGEYDIHVVKLARNGDHLWSRSFGNAEGQAGFALAPTPQAGVWIGATTYGTIRLGTDELSAQGLQDIVLVRLAP